MIELNNSQLNLISNKIQTGFKTLVDKKHREQGHITEEDLQLLNIAAENLWYAKYRAQSTESEKSNLGNILSKLGISQEDAESIFKDIDAVITGLIPSSNVATATEAPAAAAPAAAPTAAPAAAAPTAAPVPQTNPIPDQLSTLLFNLVSSRDPAKIQNAVLLINKLKHAEQTPPVPEITQEQLEGKLKELADLKNKPVELKTAIETLNNETLSALRNAVNDDLDNNISLLKALLEHGPVVNSYAQVDSRYQDTVDKMLSRLKPAEIDSDPKSYAQTLGDFKGAIHSALEEFRKTCNAVAGLNPRIALSQIKNAERKLTQALGKITDTYNQKIAKADLEIIQKAFSEARETTKQDSSARNLLETWTQKIFTAEGAVAATMLVPFLANILAGTLGDIPLIGGMIKSLAGFSSTIASSAQGLIQMLNTLNQTKTAQAVADLRKNQATPAHAEKP